MVWVYYIQEKNDSFAAAAPPYSDLTARRGIDVTSNGLVYRSVDIDLVNGFTGPQARELRPAYIF